MWKKNTVTLNYEVEGKQLCLLGKNLEKKILNISIYFNMCLMYFIYPICSDNTK